MHERAKFSEHAAKNRRIWEANAGWAGVLRQYSIGVVWGSFLRRCPFLALSVQQTAANRSKTAPQSEGRTSFDFRAPMPDPAAPGTPPQSAANDVFSAQETAQRAGRKAS
jgi:hypothetical protein